MFSKTTIWWRSWPVRGSTETIHHHRHGQYVKKDRHERYTLPMPAAWRIVISKATIKKSALSADGMHRRPPWLVRMVGGAAVPRRLASGAGASPCRGHQGNHRVGCRRSSQRGRTVARHRYRRTTRAIVLQFRRKSTLKSRSTSHMVNAPEREGQ